MRTLGPTWITNPDALLSDVTKPSSHKPQHQDVMTKQNLATPYRTGRTNPLGLSGKARAGHENEPVS